MALVLLLEAHNIKLILACESSLQISEDRFYPFSLYQAEHTPFLQLWPSRTAFSLWLVAVPCPSSGHATVCLLTGKFPEYTGTSGMVSSSTQGSFILGVYVDYCGQSLFLFYFFVKHILFSCTKCGVGYSVSHTCVWM